MATPVMVTLVTGGQPVARQRVEDVLTALHFLEGQGYAMAVDHMRRICQPNWGNPITGKGPYESKLLEEGLLEKVRGRDVLVIDPVVQRVVQAAVRSLGGHRLRVAESVDEIIRND